MRKLRAGLIGEHISRTRLPAALQIMCDMSGIKLVFELIDTAKIDPFEFDACVNDALAAGWTGVTVTHPFKVDAAGYAGAGMTADVAQVGASNTLVFGDEIRGYNTDFTGFLAAFEAIEDRGPVVMAGAGGVARSLGAALLKVGVMDLAIYDVDEGRASDLAFSLGPPARAIPLAHLETSVRDASGLVNATPLGMKEYPGSSINLAWIGSQNWAFDAVYTPTDTVFLRVCKQTGLTTISGFELFKHMAIRSFEAYTGIALKASEMMPKLEELRP